MSNIGKYYPTVYKNVLETDEIVGAENELFTELSTLATWVQENQYVLTCDITGIELYEKLLTIIPNPATESIQFRRERILNRLSMSSPFTFPLLKRRLDQIIGVGKWQAYIDYAAYTLYIESAAADQTWFHEILVTTHILKPANIIFVNKPLINANIILSEVINLNRIIYNYRLGTSWVLGRKPFVSFEDLEALKMASVPSIQPDLLANIAAFTVTDVAKARINETLVISTFISKTSIANVINLQYTVAVEAGITAVTIVELMDINDNVLTRSLVYIPVLADIVLKHTIQVKEGV